MLDVAPRTKQLTLHRHLAVLQQTYPGWHIRCRRGMWSAVRVSAPTDAQAAAGVHRYIVQASPQALAAILAYQAGILQGTHE